MIKLDYFLHKISSHSDPIAHLWFGREKDGSSNGPVNRASDLGALEDCDKELFIGMAHKGSFYAIYLWKLKRYAAKQR